MSKVINIWLFPDRESAASEQEVADYLGISVITFKDRVKRMGVDHYLTFFPGKIPSKIRRFPGAGGRNSRLSSIKKEVRDTVSSTDARSLVVALIKVSQRHYKTARCEESKSFLLNENKMLEWYLEAFPGINQRAFVQRMKRWVSEN